MLSLEARLLLVAKGAKEYFYLSAILATVKTKLWPEQAAMARQQVVDRLLALAQSLFNRHACCSRLGNLNVGGLGMPSVGPTTPAFDGTAIQPVVYDANVSFYSFIRSKHS